MCLLRKYDAFEDCDHPECLEFFKSLGEEGGSDDDPLHSTIFEEKINFDNKVNPPNQNTGSSPLNLLVYPTFTDLGRVVPNQAQPYNASPKSDIIPFEGEPSPNQDGSNALLPMPWVQAPTSSLSTENIPFDPMLSTVSYYPLFLDNFHQRVFQHLFERTQSILEIKASNDFLEAHIQAMTNDLKNLKNQIHELNHRGFPEELLRDSEIDFEHERRKKRKTKKNQAHDSQSDGNVNPEASLNPRETNEATCDILLERLNGPKNDYKYSIVVSSPFPSLLYKNRTFKFTVDLVDEKGEMIVNSNEIHAKLYIYSSDTNPKYITSLNEGRKVLSGHLEQPIINGKCHFNRVVIREDTSHFANGWLFLVVKVKNTSNTIPETEQNEELEGGKDSNYINPRDIKPLVLDHIVVNSKGKSNCDSVNVLGTNSMEEEPDIQKMLKSD